VSAATLGASAMLVAATAGAQPGSSAAASFVSSSPTAACDVASLQALVGADTTVVSARQVATPVPHCRVDGLIRVDDPGPWDVKFALALPAAFNGRYYMESQGGTAGVVPDPPATRLRDGFAVAVTDKGNRPAFSLDVEWRKDPVQHLNFAYRAIHVTTVATQRLTRAYYGVTHMYRYTAGCSGGGQAIWNAIRVYGADDYDGVVIGDYSAIAETNNITHARIVQHVMKHPDGWIPPARLLAAQQAIIATYDGVDGAVDGIVQDDRLIDFDPGLLRSAGFSQAQVETFIVIRGSWNYVLTNPPTMVGGYSLSRLTEWTGYLLGTVPPPWTQQTAGVPGAFLVVDTAIKGLSGNPNLALTDLNLDDPGVQSLFNWPDSTLARSAPFDFSRFRDGGAKVLVYHGVEDGIVKYTDALLAREQVAALEPAGSRLDDWLRVFLVPGMGHCGGGPGPDDVPDRMLAATMAWVEHGHAPDTVTARADTGRAFLLCPEPRRALFEGGGRDIDDASNWRCATSVGGTVGGTVPATLSLTLGPPASFGAFTPGLDHDYEATTAATVISTAADVALSVADPSGTARGRLVSGAFSLAEPLRARASSPVGAGGTFAPLGDTPLTLLSYPAPVSNDPVNLAFRQHVAATQPLRTGTYAKTLTFTLTTTTP
jgi:feruloyl esterase